MVCLADGSRQVCLSPRAPVHPEAHRNVLASVKEARQASLLPHTML